MENNILNINELKKLIQLKEGKINGYNIKKSNIINNILFYTNNFPINIPINERAYCLIYNINKLPQCIFCNSKQKFSYNNGAKYLEYCDNKICFIKYKTEMGIKACDKRWENHIKEEKSIITKEERYNNMVQTRRKNNPEWFTKEQKAYIKEERDKIFKDPIKNKKRLNKIKKYWNKQSNKDKQSENIKKLIKDGKFTPPITNTWTHWDSIYSYNGDLYKFRSSWEAAFWSTNKELEFETLRIPYNYKDKSHTYIVDFIDRKNKIVYEVKPDNKFLDKEKVKEQYLLEWCLKNGYKYQLINNDWFLKNYNKIDFSNNDWLYEKMKKFNQ